MPKSRVHLGAAASFWPPEMSDIAGDKDGRAEFVSIVSQNRQLARMPTLTKHRRLANLKRKRTYSEVMLDLLFAMEVLLITLAEHGCRAKAEANGWDGRCPENWILHQQFPKVTLSLWME